jgi:hypothetical protein
MKINVGQVIDEATQERIVTISSTYENSTKNISIFAREENNDVFRAVFNWDYIATGFAFRSIDGVFTEFFFEK